MGSKGLESEAGVRAVALFDHEEVGSSSAVGAGGPLMRDAITRISRALAGGETDATERCLQRSFLVSADMAHGLHPNYADKHEPDHKPEFHKCARAACDAEVMSVPSFCLRAAIVGEFDN